MVVQLSDEKLRSALTPKFMKECRWRSMITSQLYQRCAESRSGTRAGRRACMTRCFTPICSIRLTRPTRLKDLALRKLSLQTGGRSRRGGGRDRPFALAARKEVEDAGLLEVYEQIDLPLVPVLWRMEEAGVKLDCELLAGLSQRLARDCARQGARNLREGRRRVQHQLAQAAWRCVVQPAQPSQAAEVRQGTHDFDRAGCAGNIGLRARSSPARARLPPALEVEVDLCRCAAGVVPRRNQPPAHQLQSGGDGDRPTVFQQSEPAKHSHPHRAGPRDSRGLHRRARQRAAKGRLFADRAAADGALLRRRFADEGLPQRRRRAQGARRAYCSACRR